ncbi:MAG: hypothetical protein KDA57_10290 [Planctomycetales bacterium]|nr:hypothetical protein [Planctomycetales bacterium]
MKRFTLGLATLAAVAMLSVDMATAEAAHGFRGFGIHLGGPNVHLDIGNPHGYRSHQARYPGIGHSYFHGPSPHVWHNTSHFDYHPPEHIWHGNHFDYFPGHFDYHETGHWDRGYGGHH